MDYTKINKTETKVGVGIVQVKSGSAKVDIAALEEAKEDYVSATGKQLKVAYGTHYTNIFNGAMTADPEQATQQYLDELYHMTIPEILYEYLDGTTEWDNDARMIMSQCAYCDYLKMTDANKPNKLDEKDAIGIVALRYIAVTNGVYLPMDKRCVYVDECKGLDNEAIAGQDGWQHDGFANWDEIVSYYNKWYVLLSCISAITFMSLNHHYKENMFEKMRKLISASIPSSDHNALPLTAIHAFRTWNHVFGVKAIWYQYREWCETGIDTSQGKDAKELIPNALQIRKDSSPAGAAKFGVAKATISQMSSEPWYDIFKSRFDGEIFYINSINDIIGNHPPSFHVSSKLYGCDKVNTTQGDKVIRTLQPFLLGYIESLDQASKLREQYALKKNSDQGLAMQQVFTQSLQIMNQNMTANADMQTVLTGVFSQFSAENHNALVLQFDDPSEQQARLQEIKTLDDQVKAYLADAFD